MTPAQQDKLDLLRSTYPGCVHVETREGLIVVRKPSADEVIAVEDAVGNLTDLGAKPNPYAGLAEIKAVVAHPSQDVVEELLQSYPECFGQLLSLMRAAAMNGERPRLEEVDFKDEELYQRELKPDGNGKHPKRAGGRIFVVEHFTVTEPTEAEVAAWDALTEEERGLVPGDNPHKPRRVVVGRYLMRRLGLVEHREFQREVAATGALVRTRSGEERTARPSTWARIARSHVVTPLAPGCIEPDWEKHPYLLLLLGQAVRDQSALTVGSSEGKL